LELTTTWLTGANQLLGGMTFLSRRHGFTCDNIHGYEVVLASGEVVYVTADSHPDLWLALKGGSNNFGKQDCTPEIHARHALTSDIHL